MSLTSQSSCCQIVERFTDDELDAIKALHRIAQKWPASLMLVHHADSFGLQVKRVADCGDNPADAITLATVKIKTESVA